MATIEFLIHDKQTFSEFTGYDACPGGSLPVEEIENGGQVKTCNFTTDCGLPISRNFCYLGVCCKAEG